MSIKGFRRMGIGEEKVDCHSSKPERCKPLMKMRSVLLFILSVAFCSTGFSKSKLVEVEYELKTASYIGYGIIRTYKDKKIWFNELNGNDLKSVNTNAYTGNGDTKGYGYSSGFLTGYWPAIGDTVLIISDSNNRISIFAKLEQGNYRFWSPFETGSIALFSFEKPFKHLKNEVDDNPNSEKKSCSDGCLVDMALFDEKYLTRK